jgi:hypothetical protein
MCSKRRVRWSSALYIRLFLDLSDVARHLFRFFGFQFLNCVAPAPLRMRGATSFDVGSGLPDNAEVLFGWERSAATLVRLSSRNDRYPAGAVRYRRGTVSHSPLRCAANFSTLFPHLISLRRRVSERNSLTQHSPMRFRLFCAGSVLYLVTPCGADQDVYIPLLLSSSKLFLNIHSHHTPILTYPSCVSAI